MDTFYTLTFYHWIIFYIILLLCCVFLCLSLRKSQKCRLLHYASGNKHAEKEKPYVVRRGGIPKFFPIRPLYISRVQRVPPPPNLRPSTSSYIHSQARAHAPNPPLRYYSSHTHITIGIYSNPRRAWNETTRL